MPRLYLVQHAEAVAKEEDPDRPLTDRGQDEAQRVAEFAQLANIAVAEIRHSDKVRARQTAEILAEHLTPERGVRLVEGLGPKDDYEAMADDLRKEDEPVMLVGHLPFLARLASLLVTGDAKADIVLFQQAGIVCLDRDEDGQWTVAWIATPEIVK